MFSTSRTIVALGGLLLLGGTGPSQGAPEPKEADEPQQLEQLQGTWKVVAFDGAPPVRPKAGALQKPKYFLFDKHELTWDYGEAKGAAKPVQFQSRLMGAANDFHPDTKGLQFSLNGTFEGSDLVRGTYELKGDRLLICCSTPAEPGESIRDGTIRAGGRFSFAVLLQRVAGNDRKAAAKAAEAEAAELKSLQGHWQITRIKGESDHDTKVGDRLFIEGNTLLCGDIDDALRPAGPILLDPNASPKQFDFYCSDYGFGFNGPQRGIYRIDKDQLEIAWFVVELVDEKQELPKQFEVGKEPKGLQLLALKRVAAPKPVERQTRLLNLKRARAEALQVQMTGLYARIQAGRDSLITILEAQQRLMEAKLELATDKQSRIEILEEALEFVLLTEKLRIQELNEGKALVQEVDQVKARRLAVQILIEKEKAK
jgi:uncharacterized protein (TIGR03067 family)